MARTEYATDGVRTALSSVFPRSWGQPPHTEEARHAWIKQHAAEEAAKKRAAAAFKAESERFWAGIRRLEQMELRKRQLLLRELETRI
jgi:hypothetical protein